MKLRRPLAVPMTALAMLASACGGGVAPDRLTPGAAEGCVTEGTVAADGTPVAVRLDEWSVTAEPASVTPGAVTFAAANTGEEVHELVVVRGESVELLPISGGTVDEGALADGAFIGEIEGFPAATTCEGTFELAAGNYVLFCNIVEEEPDGSLESHVEEGMATTFTVTG